MLPSQKTITTFDQIVMREILKHGFCKKEGIKGVECTQCSSCWNHKTLSELKNIMEDNK